MDTSINFSFFVGGSEIGTGAVTATGAGAFAEADVVLLVNIVPKPIFERVNWDSRVRRYEGPSVIFLAMNMCYGFKHIRCEE